jgi:flagellar motor protein MotB
VETTVAAASDAQKAARARLLQDLMVITSAMDTPRGIVISIPDSSFRGAMPEPSVEATLARISSTLAVHPGLYVQVEGHTDNGGNASLSDDRASAVRAALLRSGMPANYVAARGFGSSRPLGPNAAQNRRVEIVIAGDPIGAVPTWDRTYSLR